MKILALVAAHMGSERRPGKVLADIGGKPLLWHVAERLQMAKAVRDVIITTTTEDRDTEVAEAAVAFGLKCYRGHPTDLVEQAAGAIRKYGQPDDLIFRAMSDQPFLDSRALDTAASAMFAHSWDVLLPLSFGADPVYGAGLGPWSPRAWAWIESMSVGEGRRHPGMQLRRDLARFDYGLIDLPHWAYRPFRLEMDTDQDLRLANLVWARWMQSGRHDEPALQWVVDLLDRNPEIAMVNSDIHEKTGPYTSFTRAEIAAWEKDYAGRRVLYSDFPTAVGLLETNATKCQKCEGIMITTRLGSKRVKLKCITCGAERTYRA